MYGCVVAYARNWITQCLVRLVEQCGAGFCLTMERRCMGKAIRMPDLDLFVPGFLDLSFCGGREEFQQCIVISRWFVPHRSLL